MVKEASVVNIVNWSQHSACWMSTVLLVNTVRRPSVCHSHVVVTSHVLQQQQQLLSAPWAV